jgi:hypothetical protein
VQWEELEVDSELSTDMAIHDVALLFGSSAIDSG